MLFDTHKNNISALVLSFFAMAVILFSCPCEGFAQDRNKLEKQKAKLEKEIASMNAILNETKKTKKMSSSELQVLKKKIASRQNLIKNISSQMGMLNNEIKSTQK